METIIAGEIAVGTVIGGIIFFSFVKKEKNKLKRQVLRHIE